jgi:epimerase transport system membrane fusion protein
VQVRIPEEELAALPNVKALPGMPAQAMLETGTQTVMNYLLSPLLGAMFTAMREKS